MLSAKIFIYLLIVIIIPDSGIHPILFCTLKENVCKVEKPAFNYRNNAYTDLLSDIILYFTFKRTELI